MKNKLLFYPALLIIVLASGFSQTPAPTTLTAVSNNAIVVPTITLSWEYPDGDQDVTFSVYKKAGNGDDTTVLFEKIARTENRRYTDHHVKRGVLYSYYVTAKVGEMESEPSNTVEAQLRPIEFGMIAGIVVDDSTNLPLKKCVVKLIPALDIRGDIKCVVTDDNGQFSMKLKTGGYYLFVSAEGYVGEYFNNVFLKSEASLISVTANDSLSLAIGLAKKSRPKYYSLSGWVKNAEGNPVKASVTAFVINKRNIWDWHWWKWCNRKLYDKTDSLGNYTLRLREGDTAVVYIHPKDRKYLPEFWNNKAKFAEADRIGISGDVSNINVTVDPKLVYNNGISGSVWDSSGTMALDARVYAYQKTHDRYGCKRYYTETDSNGMYSFSNLKPGAYIVLAWSKGYKPTYFRYDGEPTRRWRKADTIYVSDTTYVEHIDFKLQPRKHAHAQAVVYGNVTVSADVMADAALVYAVDATGELEASAMVEADGTFELEEMGTGSYSLVVTLMGYGDTQSDGVDIASENENKQKDMTLQPDEVSGVGEGEFIASQYRLNQNYPNPFNPGTVVSFVIGQQSFVTVKVYNILGNEVVTLVSGVMQAGEHEVLFDGSNLPSGIYLARLTANNSVVAVRKMMLMK